METTVVKGFLIIETLVRADAPCNLTDLAAACGLSKSNAHRLLRTLEACRYVRQDPISKTYEPTLRVWELGTRVFQRLDLRGIAAPHMRKLADETGESIHLSVLDHNEVLYVDTVESIHTLRAFVGVGDRAPAYCTATGKAMLAFLPPLAVEEATRTMKRFTPLTHVDHAKLDADLARIRGQGYSATGGEWQAGVIGIAAPIRGDGGAVVGAIGVAGPEERMRKADFAEQAAAVLAAAAAISSGLGLTEVVEAAPPARRPRRDARPQAISRTARANDQPQEA